MHVCRVVPSPLPNLLPNSSHTHTRTHTNRLTGCSLYGDCQEGSLLERVKTPPPRLQPGLWAGLSPAARDLILRLLVVKPALRLSVHSISRHPWCCGRDDLPAPLPDFLAAHDRLLAAEQAPLQAPPAVLPPLPCSDAPAATQPETQTQPRPDGAAPGAGTKRGRAAEADSGAAEGAEGTEAVPPPAKRAEPADTRPMCKYGANCYRKNPKHFEEFRHPPR